MHWFTIAEGDVPDHNGDVLVYYGKDFEGQPEYEVAYYDTEDEMWMGSGCHPLYKQPVKWAEIEEPEE
jgi:hypothetical protein